MTASSAWSTAVFVAKDEHGDLTQIRATDFSEEETVLFGVLAGALFGLAPRARKARRWEPWPAGWPPRAASSVSTRRH